MGVGQTNENKTTKETHKTNATNKMELEQGGGQTNNIKSE